MKAHNQDPNENYRFTIETPRDTEDVKETLQAMAEKKRIETEESIQKIIDNGRKEAEGTNKREEATESNNTDEMPSLKEVIQEQAVEGEAPMSTALTLRKILGGDILNTTTIRKQLWLFLLITFFLFIYISNRYSCQNALIKIDRLTKELQDVKYKSLSSNSQITDRSRESHVLQLLRNSKDTTIRMSDQPPYMVNVPEE